MFVLLLAGLPLLFAGIVALIVSPDLTPHDKHTMTHFIPALFMGLLIDPIGDHLQVFMLGGCVLVVVARTAGTVWHVKRVKSLVNNE